METDQQLDRLDILLLLGRIDANVTTLLVSKTDHERRITALENLRWKVAGLIAGAGVLWAAARAHFLQPLFAIFQ